jgi:formylglycine-generating enzyme required for sulfatase activity
LAAGPEPTEVASSEAPPAPAASEPALPEPPLDDFTGVVFRDCLDCPDMAEIPAGGEASLASFALSRREVTFEEWRLCVADGGCRGYSPSDREQGRGKRPAVRISYEDARAYVEWLSSKTGRRYRLPTEREWTFAALAGGEGPFPRNFAPSPDLANFAEGPWRKSLPAGSFRPSDYGLFDMQGNVWEWTEDCAGGEGGPCAARVLKGGAFDAPAQSLKASARTARSQSARLSNVGFRVARELP